MVDKAAYWLAVLTLLTLPGALLFWYLIHPFAATWRRLGRLPAYTIILALWTLLAYVLWLVREPLLRVRYGFNPWLAALAVVLYAIAVYIEIRCRRHLKFHILAGGPELSRDDPGKLLDQGIYSRIRHPRYMSLMFGMTAAALFMNYQVVYLMLLACVPLVYGIVLIEERELKQRFGDAYVEYSRQVPRFIPHWRSP
jgi:protein-S-isoprenylcysteine O-methyltransferase Ste14